MLNGFKKAAKFSGRCQCGAQVSAGQIVEFAPAARGGLFIAGCAGCGFEGVPAEELEAEREARAEQARRADATRDACRDAEALSNLIEDLSARLGSYRLPARLGADDRALAIEIAGLAWRTKAAGLCARETDFAREVVRAVLALEKAEGRQFFAR